MNFIQNAVTIWDSKNPNIYVYQFFREINLFWIPNIRILEKYFDQCVPCMSLLYFELHPKLMVLFFSLSLPYSYLLTPYRRIAMSIGIRRSETPKGPHPSRFCAKTIPRKWLPTSVMYVDWTFSKRQITITCVNYSPTFVNAKATSTMVNSIGRVVTWALLLEVSKQVKM